MKKILMASFGALVLAGAMGVAHAASVPTAVATPYTEGQTGSQMLPAFNYKLAEPVFSSPDPAVVPTPGDPPAIVPDALSSGGSGGAQAMPTFNSGAAVAVPPSVEGLAPMTKLDASTGVASLLNREGGGR